MYVCSSVLLEVFERVFAYQKFHKPVMPVNEAEM